MKGSSQQKKMQVSGSKEKRGWLETSLMVQWLRLLGLTIQGLTPGQGTNFHMLATKHPTRHSENPVQPSN